MNQYEKIFIIYTEKGERKRDTVSPTEAAEILQKISSNPKEMKWHTLYGIPR